MKIPNFDYSVMSADDRIGVLSVLCESVKTCAPNIGEVLAFVEYPAYVSVTVEGVTDDEGVDVELCLGFGADSRGTVFSWDCPQVSLLSGVIDLVEVTYEGVAREFWAQVFGQCLSLTAIHVGGN